MHAVKAWVKRAFQGYPVGGISLMHYRGAQAIFMLLLTGLAARNARSRGDKRKIKQRIFHHPDVQKKVLATPALFFARQRQFIDEKPLLRMSHMRQQL